MQKIKNLPWPSLLALALGWSFAGSAALAQPDKSPPVSTQFLAPAAFLASPPAQVAGQPLTLKMLFERAWARQPEAQSTALRRGAAQAELSGASSWTADPVALQLQTKTDRPGSNQGSREVEVGVAIPLWLPGERARKTALGGAQLKAVESRQQAAQLQLAASVRDAWWTLQRAQTEQGLAHDRLRNAQHLAADVTRRFKAGDMSRADQTQAQAAVAQAEAVLAETTGVRDSAQAALGAWGGGTLAPSDHEHLATEPLPEVEGLPDGHPAVADLRDQADVARYAADLAAAQTRANPELTVSATRGREQSGERYAQTVTLGVRVPLGGGGRAHAKELAAQANALDAELRASAERDRLATEVVAAQARVIATQGQRDAMTRYAALARDARGFVDKAFRLGEADWPTRLRVELDAAQADRQLARTRIDAAAAVSTLRQAMGLLPQ